MALDSESFRGPVAADAFVAILERRGLRPAAPGDTLALGRYRRETKGEITYVTWNGDGRANRALKRQARMEEEVNRINATKADPALAADDEPLDIEVKVTPKPGALERLAEESKRDNGDRFEQRRRELLATRGAVYDQVAKLHERLAALDEMLAAFELVAKELEG